MLYVGAALIRCFGFSYTLLRLSSVTEAALTLLILHRLYTRVGLSERYASLGVLTLALSPVFLWASVLYVTDIPGLLAILLCFYACLRALESAETRAAIGWISAAAVSNALLGTTRQVAWLGVLTIVPCALYLLRQRWRVLRAGVVSLSVSLGFVGLVLIWFGRQPYILPESLLLQFMPPNAGRLGLVVVLRLGLDLAMFAFPITIGLFVGLRFQSLWRWLLTALLCCLFSLAFRKLETSHTAQLGLAPFLYIAASAETAFGGFPPPALGPTSLPISHAMRVVLTIWTLLSVSAVLARLVARLPPLSVAAIQQMPGARRSVDGTALAVLVLPYVVAYTLLLLPRGIIYGLSVDRYLLFLLPFVLVGLLRPLQALDKKGVHWVSALPLAAMGMYSVLALHDVFAIYRANLRAISEVRAAGVERSRISGGLEYNFDTEVLATGWVKASGIRLPNGRPYQPVTKELVTPCSQFALEMTPSVQPVFAVSTTPSPCIPVPAYAPVRFRAWLPPFQREMVIVRYAHAGTMPVLP